MKLKQKFKRQALVLFFAVALFPALTVSALWYTMTRSTASSEVITVGGFFVPIAILGLMPAIILGIVFAELLAIPIRRIKEAIGELKQGHLDYRTHFPRDGEFADMAADLNDIAEYIQSMLSQEAGETEMIRAESNKLRAVLDTMVDGVFAIDASGHVMLFNKAAQELTGLTMADVAGQPSDQLLPFYKSGQPVLAQWLADRRSTGREISEWRGLELVPRQGKRLYVDTRAVKLSGDPNGISALVTFHDLTSSHDLEEMKVDFVALAAHELRTPLASIRGYLDNLQTDLENSLSANQKMYLQRSITSAKHLSAVVNNILNVSRVEHGELGLDFQDLDWHELMSELKVDFETRATAAGRVIEFQLAPQPAILKADRSSLSEVLSNLVDNAIAHTSAGGHITLASALKGNELEVTVTDNGSGIPTEAIPKLFTKFYRVEGLHTTKGTGLGLFISRAIIEAHGGHIWVESKLGQGSSFGFGLPVISKVAPDKPKAHNETNERVTVKGGHGWIKKDSLHRR